MPSRSLLKHVLVFALLVMVCAVGCQTSHMQARSLPPEYRAASQVGRGQLQLRGMTSFGAASTMVGPGDLLEITITSGRAGEETAPVAVRVSEQGLVDVPYVGSVQLAGAEPSAAAARIASTAVERGVYVRPQVNVVVTEQATNRVTVLGAVSEPGVQEVPRSACDVLAAIAHAGGFTEEAGTVVEILRHDGPTLAANDAGSETPKNGVQPVSFDAPPLSPAGARGPERTQEIDLAQLHTAQPSQYSLSDRDVVVVRPREKRLVHVTGLVQKPDQFELPNDQDLRVLDAVAMAGGVTSPVADKVIVVRHVEAQSEPIIASVSISRAKRDGSENIVLQPGDLISVEHTVATTVVDTLHDLFRITMGVGGNLTLF